VCGPEIQPAFDDEIFLAPCRHPPSRNFLEFQRYFPS